MKNDSALKITDKQRLDWLTKNKQELVPLAFAAWHVTGNVYPAGHYGKSPRQAIDAAIKAERSKRKR